MTCAGQLPPELDAGERMPFFTQDRGFRLLTVVEAEPAQELESTRSISRAIPAAMETSL